MKLLVPSVWSISENLSLWSVDTISAKPASPSAGRDPIQMPLAPSVQRNCNRETSGQTGSWQMS
ncbi:hypothetical protein G0U57_021382 [Chelydra serpentina]|uniref:Uncharacterized protein n=1 Tax=Chelydra serpentina TaxID=8475 RepID=A0A8T1S2H2_CHESE|nr:hypothetical protein G0U57_021382 [Chelydra serpentina]